MAEVGRLMSVTSASGVRPSTAMQSAFAVIVNDSLEILKSGTAERFDALDMDLRQLLIAI